MMLHYNPSTWEAEAGRSGVQGHAQLYIGFNTSLSSNKQTKPNTTHEKALWAKVPALKT